MSGNRCDGCGRYRPSGRFDATFQTVDDREVHAFGVAARYCRRCPSLAIDPETLLILGLADARFTSAIGSDPDARLLLGRAA